MRDVDRATDSVLRVVKEHDWHPDGCALCADSEYDYRLRFGFDGSGPWAALGCSEPGCDAHQACRPMFSVDDPDPRDDAFVAVLFDMAEETGWRLDRGAWCPEHHPEA
jgi:hypothetical protein